MSQCFSQSDVRAIPVIPVQVANYEQWLSGQDERLQRVLSGCGFRAVVGNFHCVSDSQGNLQCVVVVVKSADDPWALSILPKKLPEGSYRIQADWSAQQLAGVSLGWGLGCYQFDRYKSVDRPSARLVIDEGCDGDGVENLVAAIALMRDLVNTPAQDMMPDQLAEVVENLARTHGGTVKQVIGDALLTENYPVIHAVGRASVHAPRLIDLCWGDENAPKLTLVGKGVCFDSGGLDLKSAAGMRLMKKDMGGAAQAIALASLVMSARLPVRLRLLVPAVENAVSGNAQRPGDIVRSRKGLTIEIDNTDAEGRLILCDALCEGASEAPDLMMDFATLTGAGRVALGLDVPAMFSNDDAVADGVFQASQQHRDPVWRLPLHDDYRSQLNSPIADLVNSAGKPYGGCITAALFLQAFVPDNISWAHFDFGAWNDNDRPGRTVGGMEMGLRAVFAYLQQRYAGK